MKLSHPLQAFIAVYPSYVDSDCLGRCQGIGMCCLICSSKITFYVTARSYTILETATSVNNKGWV